MDFPFESDPRFAQLSYSDQTELRAKYALKMLSADPRFSTLTSADQADLLRRASDKPPVFADAAGPAAQGSARIDTEAKKGNLGPAKTAAFFGTADQQMSLLAVAGKVADKLLGKPVMQEMLLGPDARKYTEYARAKAGGAGAVGAVAGTLLDLLSYGVGQGSLGTRVAMPFTRGAVGLGVETGVAKLGVSNLVERGLESTVKTAPVFSKWLVGSAAPAAIRVINMGLQGVGREALLKALSDQPVESNIGKIAQTFGAYAGLNSAFWTAVNIALPFASLAARVVRGAAHVDPLMRVVDSVTGKARSLTAEEFNTWKVAYGQGNLPPENFASLGVEAKDVFEGNKQFDFYKNSPEAAMRDPYGRAVLAGQGMGKFVVKAEGGGYRIRDFIDRSATTTVETLNDLDTAMAMLLKSETKLMDETQIAALRADPLKNYLFTILDKDAEIQKTLAKAKGPGATAVYVPLSKRLMASPLEAEHLNMVTPDTTTVDTYNMSLSQGTRGMLEKLKPAAQSRMLRGAPAIPLSKTGEPNVMGVFTSTAGPDEVAAAQAWAKRAKEAGSTESIDALVPVSLKRAGYDSARMADGTMLALYPERLKILDNTINPKTGKSGAFRVPNRTPTDVKVEVFGARAMVGNTAVAGSDTLLTNIVNTMGESPDRQRVQRFSELAAKRLGLGEARIRVTMLDDTRGVEVKNIEGGLRITVPSSRAKWGGKGTYAEKILTAIDEHMKTDAPLPRGSNALDYTVDNLKTNAESLGQWFVAQARRDPAIATWLAKQSLTSPTPEQWGKIARRFAADNTTPAELKVQLSQFGVRLIDRGSELIAVKNGKVLGTGADVSSLLTNSRIELPRSPARFGPKLASIDPDGVSFNVADQQVIGAPEKVLQFLDHYEDTSKEAAAKELLSTGKGTVTMFPSAGFEVSIPSLGLRQTFATPAEASAYLRGGYTEWQSLTDAVERKGGVMRFVEGKYRLYFGRDVHEAATLEDLGKVLARYPDPAALPDIVPEDVTHYFKEKNPLIGWNATRIRYTAAPPEPEKPAFLKKMSMLLKPMTAWVTDFATSIGDTETLGKYNDVEFASRVSTRETDVGHAIVDKMLDDVAKAYGMKWNETKNSAFYYWMEVVPGQEDRYESIKTAFSLKTPDVEAFTVLKERMRAFLGETPDAEGSLFRKFGVDPRRFLWDYMSRVREFMDKSSIETLNTADPVSDSVLKKVFASAGQGVPKEVEAWFMNQRTSDVAAFALDTNFSRVMKKYITRGNLALYVDEPWRNLRNTISREGVDPAMQWRVFRYMDMLQGGGQTDGDRLMKNFAYDFLRRLGMEPSKARMLGNDSMAALYSISYTSHLGWRPYSAIRNLAQVYQTTGVMFGHSYVNEAVRQLSADKTGKIVRYLKQLGVIHEAPPLVSKILDAERLIGKVTKNSMNMFMSADELGRAVAYLAGARRWDDVVAAFPKVTEVNGKRFIENLNANFFGPDIEGRILTAAKAGDLRNAKHVYANAAQEMSMFLMRREQTPTAFHGFIGKMFGQFGNFATSYAAFSTRAAHYGTPAQKVAFYGRWLATGAAFAAASYAVGLRWQDWMPWAPGVFTGGPIFTNMMNIMHATGSDYSSRQARGELNNLLPVNLNKLYWKVREGPLAGVPGVGAASSVKSEGSLLQMPRSFPGYYQLKAALDMVKYAEAGDPLKMFYALTSAPIRSDLR